MDYNFGNVLENISKLKKRKENFILVIKEIVGLDLEERDFSFLQNRIFLNLTPNKKFLIKQKELEIIKTLKEYHSENFDRLI